MHFRIDFMASRLPKRKNTVRLHPRSCASPRVATIDGFMERGVDVNKTGITWAGFMIVALLTSSAAALPICETGKRITCVVDGDTVWVDGTKYRFEEIDTP